MTEVGMFTINRATRRATGILLPWGVKSKGTSSSNTRPITFPRGSVRLPRDPMVVGLNDEHDRFPVIGRADVLEDRPEGIYAEFAIADTDEADAWLDDHPDGAHFSAEVDALTRAPGDLGAGVLAGAAATETPAFDGTGMALFSLRGEETEIDEPVDEETTDADGASEDEPDDVPDDDESEDAVAEATVNTQAAFSRQRPEAKPGLTKRAFFRMIDDVMGGRADTATRAFVSSNLGPGEAGMFALSDIDYDGVAGVGAKMSPAQWIGEVALVSYTPIWSDLFPTLPLSSLSLGGWQWGVKPAGGTWTGNKTDVPSNTPSVLPVTETATRWAMGHDIAREHRDFGTPGFFESYNQIAREDYEKWKDTTIVRTEVIAGATDLEADDPTGVTIGAGWSALIDGAAELITKGYLPTFALIETALWKSMLKVPQSDTLGYLEAALNLEAGSLGGFRFRPAEGLTPGHIIVGSRAAADVYQLPGTPVRAEALNMALGGIDVGHFGYAGLHIKDPLGIVDVAPFVAGP